MNVSFEKITEKLNQDGFVNILILGNGFDIAHGLPTKYQLFLEFCKEICSAYGKIYLNNITNSKLLSYIGELTKNIANNV